MEQALERLRPSIIEAVLRQCGYEDVQVDLALFQYTNDDVYVYTVATGTCDEDAVYAVVLISQEENGELVAVLLNKPVYEDYLEEKPMQGPHLPGEKWR